MLDWIQKYMNILNQSVKHKVPLKQTTKTIFNNLLFIRGKSAILKKNPNQTNPKIQIKTRKRCRYLKT